MASKYSEDFNADMQKKAAAIQSNASSETLEAARQLAERSENLCNKVLEKLNKYMRQNAVEENGPRGEPIRSYPPYFDMMRDEFFRINNALESIETFISQTEL